MAKQFAKSFLVNGDVDALFDAAEKFLVAKGFTITSSQKPGAIIATRGTKVGSYISTKMEDQSTSLKVDLLQQGDQIHVACNYNIYVVGLMSSSDRMFLENEVEQMKMSLLSVAQIGTRMEHQVPEPVEAPKPQPEEPARQADYTIELEKLAKLRDKGVITDKDFNAKKRQLLGL
ncbi:MAG: SHOCT domain-containing protein [Methanomassiliicoccales archaeon]|nr:SHOCT domain-containing protein [Methanomassiliicoccales archaeon]